MSFTYLIAYKSLHFATNLLTFCLTFVILHRKCATMNNIKVRWKAFCEWQRQPALIIKKSAEMHCCTTCGEEFQGNYCPQCGQSAMIGRYSFKKAVLLFLDVWGLGNRGMFRTLRDLILRPG